MKNISETESRALGYLDGFRRGYAANAGVS